MIEIKSYAKINLTLDVIERLEDGYHRIESIKQQVGLHDEVVIEPCEALKIVCNHPDIAAKENLVYKTALLLKNEYNVPEGAKITVRKNIPLAAGLAGGSSNAAAALIGLNKLWNLELDSEELSKLAAEIGMDVPFSVAGGSCFAEGKGTKLKKIELPEMDILLINPGFEVSTRTAYQSLDLTKTGKVLATRKLLELENKSPAEIAKLMHNDFEIPLLSKHSALKEIKNDLMENNALNAIVSGSGPTMFGLFENRKDLDKAYDAMNEHYPFVSKTKTINKREE